MENMNNQENNNLEVIEGTNFVVDLTTANRVSQWCSMNPKTQQEKIALFNAMNNPENRIKECINLPINVKDVFCEVVECQSDDGTLQKCPRIVLIDENAVGYVAVSKGVYNSIKKIFAIFGEPTWETPLTIIPKTITKGQKQITTLELGMIKK